VLFLDELPEFRRSALEALRQPLEEGAIRIVRAHGALRLPARFQWVAAMNPCPCGYSGDPARECRCDDGQLRRYRGKLSGPLLDRVDLHVPVPSASWRALVGSRSRVEGTAAVRARVEAARARQLERQGCTNGDLDPRALRTRCRVEGAGLALLERAVDGLGVSLRAISRLVRVARTIADLAARPQIEPEHLAEALAYRVPPI
jgi:magnesium chelatase family protein